MAKEPKTKPWLPDELLLAGGLPLVYTFENGELLVHLPGGKTVTVSELQAAGVEVVLPARLRAEEECT